MQVGAVDDSRGGKGNPALAVSWQPVALPEQFLVSCRMATWEAKVVQCHSSCTETVKRSSSPHWNQRAAK